MTDPGFKIDKLKNDCNENPVTLPKARIGRLDDHQCESITGDKTPRARMCGGLEYE
ncbi:hypothetical protein ACQCP0_17085 [Ralstonia pseudosolanacearum]|uniref:hypothetical protein n=1 Tax=Ralstonia pseudosolanacearum TaxID=1310165 RepID=UPI001404250F|nr:hypothetical protein [Ralstonia pseudosolanacearum]QKL92436.1 hypothetical protein HI802_10155 [Ralstonia solanacearum]MCK4129371.1 hypothetical protein [Ralstonia pseudosolanacearum]QKL97513.1 hypothetical protein HI801_10160 [Ralstonia solanacearum]QLR07405.1 hypothetical protein H1A20_10090 [Ralstonia solanacearum]UNJ28311.1 hypothetical protein MNY32_09705 [Ralstonia pseudosolanacearum]